jgi:hypothetical protein
MTMPHENLSNGIEYKFVEPEASDPEFAELDDPQEVARWRENYARWEREVAYLQKWLARCRPTARRTKLVVRAGGPAR